MSKFILDNNKDFESVKAKVPLTQVTLELRKIDKTYYSIFYHADDIVTECGTFTKQELKTVWKMMST